MEKVYRIRNITDIRDLCESSCELFAENTAFLWRKGGTVYSKTYREVGEDVRALATFLNHRGYEGKRIAIMGPNGYEWALSYLAVTSGVGIVMPTDRDLREEQLAFVLQEADVLLYHKSMEEVVMATPFTGDLLCLSEMDTYLREGNVLRQCGDRSYETHVVNPKAFGVLLYTSGTMGVGKGVMLSQYNIAVDVMGALQVVRYYPEDRGLSVLPLHHTYECTAGFLGFFYSGASIAYCGSLRTLMEDFRVFQPTMLVTVPLMLETFHKNIEKKYRQLRGGMLVKNLQKLAAHGEAGRRRIYGLIHENFGGKLRGILCGAAPLPAEIFEAFRSYGIRMYVGYGLTETAPICLMHDDEYQSPNDTGYPLGTMEVQIVEPDENGVGELAVKGQNVMLGYYKQPEETAAVLRDGWFYTGDLAKQMENGAYAITGRLKTMIVTDNGKKVFPEELEIWLAKNPNIKDSMVYQDADGKIHAAVYPDPDWSLAEEEKEAQIRTQIADINRHFPSYKRIAAFHIRREPFVKTTTHKIKRNAPENREEKPMN